MDEVENAFRRINGKGRSAIVDSVTFEIQCPFCQSTMISPQPAFLTKVRNMLLDLKEAIRIMRKLEGLSEEDRKSVQVWLASSFEHRNEIER